MLAIDFHTVGLAIWSIWPAHIGAFVPVQTEPLEIGDELIFKTSFAAFDVGVFDPQDDGATMAAGEEPIEQSSTRIAHMKLAGRRRSKTNSHGGCWGHVKMLAVNLWRWQRHRFCSRGSLF